MDWAAKLYTDLLGRPLHYAASTSRKRSNQSPSVSLNGQLQIEPSSITMRRQKQSIEDQQKR